MRVAHLLRKCDPAEWGGTETAIQRLFEGLRQHQVDSVVYCPRVENNLLPDPLLAAGCCVKRFRAFLPVWGLAPADRRRHLSIGGNVMSLDLLPALWREPELSLIHTHTLGRLGGIAAAIARRRRVPLVVTIHGGLLDRVPSPAGTARPATTHFWDWGKVFGWALRSRQLLDYTDAVLTCNPQEAALLQAQYPHLRIHVQAHSVPVAAYRADCRATARTAFPELNGQAILLCVGRLDPIKNQRWLVDQAPALLRRHPNLLLLFVGAATDVAYAASLRHEIGRLGLHRQVRVAGALPPNDPRLIGLLQLARAVLLPSLSETFGLVILEAWAAGTPVISSRTSGPSALVQHGHNGWLFALEEPASFHAAVDAVLERPQQAAQLVGAGRERVNSAHDTAVVSAQVKSLYEQLLEQRHALRHSPRR